MFPGGFRKSLVISSESCQDDNSREGTPPCPLPTGGLLKAAGTDDVSSASSNATDLDESLVDLLNITGSGRTTVETFGFYTGSNAAPTPIPKMITYIGDNLVVNYPGGSRYSWALDIGAVSFIFRSLAFARDLELVDSFPYLLLGVNSISLLRMGQISKEK